ncbi:MAG: hypothetical protein KF749_02990 [Bacteroidetes bacterium]|nr:hypothetical protein [Bacteroidota bacterium]MCW5896782.1 hypothetical protein [Bacteroidota bacterium]
MTMKRVKLKRVLLSFVGTNDAGKLKGDSDGAILTIFKKRQFEEVHLIWNTSEAKNLSFEHIAKYVRDEIVNRGHCDTVKLHRFDCDDVTDHNEIYPKLLAFCNSLGPAESKKFTAAIASGTPAMQVCWILMAESGDFPLELIRSNEPRFGKAPVTPIRLGTGLPRIIRLEQENEFLKKEKLDLVPELKIEVSKGRVLVGGIEIRFSPIEFSYYRYFAERDRNAQEFERFSGIAVPRHFLEKVVTFHRESFPESELFRDKLERMLSARNDLSVGTFRANIVKLNTKIKNALKNPALQKLLMVTTEGKRHALFYGLQMPSHKIRITK